MSAIIPKWGTDSDGKLIEPSFYGKHDEDDKHDRLLVHYIVIDTNLVYCTVIKTRKLRERQYLFPPYIKINALWEVYLWFAK